MKNKKFKSIKSLIAMAGLMLTSTALLACSTVPSFDDSINQRPIPKTIQVFVAEKSDK